MRVLVAILFGVCACNAIDGADGYQKTDDGAGGCSQSCIDTSSACLGNCASTLASCKAGCGANQGCSMKCDNNANNCTTGCVSTCTACGCSQPDCTNPPDAGND